MFHFNHCHYVFVFHFFLVSKTTALGYMLISLYCSIYPISDIIVPGYMALYPAHF